MVNIDSLGSSEGLDFVIVEGKPGQIRKSLEFAGYEIASAEQIVGARTKQEIDAKISKTVGFTKEGILYVPKNGAFLVKDSPVNYGANKSEKCFDMHGRLLLEDGELERALVDSLEITGYVLRDDSPCKKIPTDRFGEDEFTVFLFGDMAGEYGQYLNTNGIKEMPLQLTPKKCFIDKPKAYAEQLRLGDIQTYKTVRTIIGEEDLESITVSSEIYGSKYYYVNSLFGVCPVEAKEARECYKILEGVKNDLERVLERLGHSKTIKMRVSDLCESSIKAESKGSKGK